MPVAPISFFGLKCNIDTGMANTTLLIAPYHGERFHPDMFQRLGVACPATIRSSVVKRQASFLAGRALVAHAFDLAQLPPSDIPIGPNRAPIWPTGISGSISHTTKFCACLVSQNPMQFVGIDIETFLTAKNLPAVMKRVITDHEKKWLATQDDEIDLELCTLIFSAKETIYKALFPIAQHFFGFDAAHISALPNGQTIQFHLTQHLHQSLPSGLTLTVHYKIVSNHVLTWLIFDQPQL